MNKIKLIIVIIFISFLVFLISKRSENLNIEGEWSAKEIVLNGKLIYPADLVDSLFENKPKVIINNWKDSIYINEKTSARFQIEENLNGNNYITLSSNESSLNGKFIIEIDTIHQGPRAYEVNVKIQSKRILLHLQKEVNRGEWKPPFPKKGNA